MEKYGFIYIWLDRKHKRHYIGCRWGNESDRYICSSRWMRKSYKRRPNDFKRRIISRVYTNRQDLLQEEYRWLQMIPDYQLGKNYYNLSKKHFGHWASDDNKRKSVSEKIKASFTDERRKELSDAKLGNKNPMKNPEVIAKRLETYKKGNHKAWNKGSKTGPNPEHSERMKGRTAWNKGQAKPLEQRMAQAKQWKIIKPCGEIEIITNLNIYCAANNLTQANMLAVANGKRQQHKGYRCYRV